MYKRMIGIFCAVLLVMTAAMTRIYYLGQSDYLAAAASVQGKYALQIASSRGMIYDRNLNELVNKRYRYVAAVLPSPEAAAVLIDVVDEEGREALVNRLSAAVPFTMEVPDDNIYAYGVDVFRVYDRYDSKQIAPHIIGYLNGDGSAGVAGIEKAHDQLLKRESGWIDIHYMVDAVGRTARGGSIDINRQNLGARGGVVLTLDRDIQQLVQTALEEGCQKGAAVVMDIYTGDILAIASTPAFDPNNITASLDDSNTPFINRAISAYNIGSTFKLITAAAALEQGYSSSYQYECKGYIDVNGQIFKCQNTAGHGLVDMEQAVSISCNPYFINLAIQVGPQPILAMARNLGIGNAAELAPGLWTQPGNLPALQELSSDAAIGNFGFGQGQSLASPLQIAQVISAIANSGRSVPPRIVRGTTEDGAFLNDEYPIYASTQVMDESTAALLKNFMIEVIENGSGTNARPIAGGAGGKTASAQTGQYEEEEEIVHAWFSGFYPAQSPRYSIVVFAEGEDSGGKVAAPIFKRIADGIQLLS